MACTRPMDFGDALARLRAGGTVERPGLVLRMYDGEIHRILSALGNHAAWAPTQADILARDWEDRHKKYATVRDYNAVLVIDEIGRITATVPALDLEVHGTSRAPVLEALDRKIAEATHVEPEPEPETIETLDRKRQEAAVAASHAAAAWRDALAKVPVPAPAPEPPKKPARKAK